MQVGRRNALLQFVAKPAMAGLLAVLVLFFSTAAVSPALHQWLHADANSPDHSCVVTTLTKGQVDAGLSALVVVVFVALVCGFVVYSENLLLPAADYRYSSSRAPPFFGSLA
jgi:hypothetical protein